MSSSLTTSVTSTCCRSKSSTIILARSLRQFGMAATASSMPMCLRTRGFPMHSIGLILSSGLFGATLSSLMVPMAPPSARPRLLRSFTLAMACSAFLLASVGLDLTYWAVSLVAFCGGLALHPFVAPQFYLEEELLGDDWDQGYTLAASGLSVSLGAFSSGIPVWLGFQDEIGHGVILGVLVVLLLASALLQSCPPVAPAPNRPCGEEMVQVGRTGTNESLHTAGNKQGPYYGSLQLQEIAENSTENQDDANPPFIEGLRRWSQMPSAAGGQRRRVAWLALLLSLDALAGGMVVFSLATYWMHIHFGVARGVMGLMAGTLFAGASVSGWCAPSVYAAFEKSSSSISAAGESFGDDLFSNRSEAAQRWFPAPGVWLPKLMSLLPLPATATTVCLLHLPTTIALLLVPLCPTAETAFFLFFIRSLFVQLDNSVRDAFVERRISSGFTKAVADNRVAVSAGGTWKDAATAMSVVGGCRALASVCGPALSFRLWALGRLHEEGDASGGGPDDVGGSGQGGGQGDVSGLDTFNGNHALPFLAAGCLKLVHDGILIALLVHESSGEDEQLGESKAPRPPIRHALSSIQKSVGSYDESDFSDGESPARASVDWSAPWDMYDKQLRQEQRKSKVRWQLM